MVCVHACVTAESVSAWLKLLQVAQTPRSPALCPPLTTLMGILTGQFLALPPWVRITLGSSSLEQSVMHFIMSYRPVKND